MINNFLNKIDKTIFFFSIIAYLCLFIFIIGLPDAAKELISGALNFTLNNFGWFYMLSFTCILLFMIWIAFSKYGQLKLGKKDEKPAYSFTSWIGMLCGAGLGVGLVFFGVTEPMSHFMTAPFNESGTAEAASNAMRHVFFHWGVHPWAMYSLCGLCFAYAQFRKDSPALFSSTLIPILGKEKASGLAGKVVDAFSIIAIIAGVSTSMGVSANQITSALHTQFGIGTGQTVVMIALSLIAIISTLSAVKGIEKGIKLISDANMLLVYILIAFILLFGPTKYIFYLFFETFGNYLRDLPWLSFFLDANSQVEKHVGYNWIGSWTVMYWAWWVAFAPFVGGFLAQISRGRTIKEFVLATSLVPSILCFVWFVGYGGTAIHLDLFQNMGLGNTIVKDPPNSMFVLLNNLPFNSITIIAATFLCLTLIITSVNSATYQISTIASGGTAVSSMGLRVVWGVFLFANAALFLFIGGLKTLQNCSIALALPFMGIIILMMFSLAKDLRTNVSA